MKYIIFDFDGTIADSSNVFMDAWNLYADEYQYDKVDISEIAATKHMTIPQRAKKYRFPMHKLPIILPKIYRYFNEHTAEIRSYPGIKETLIELKRQGYELFILSSNNKDNILKFLAKEQITLMTDILTSSKLFGKDKILKKFMKQQRIEPNQILYIGDEFRDLEACSKVGIPFGWASWGLDGEQLIDTLNPTYKFKDPHNIIELIK